jgi:tRNA pseudouridine38-40 synthase
LVSVSLMKAWKLTLEYDGTRYSGWQEQRNARTVQGDLRAAVEEYFGTEVELQGAGRTDAGVHAAAQVAHVKVQTKRVPPPETLLRELNSRLPADIAILEIEPVSSRFHARHDAVSRSYVYQISARKSAFSKRYVWWVKEPLDVPAMDAAARRLAGRHDFVCFAAADPSRPNESTVVVVEAASVSAEGDLIVFRIEASHFIWRMVRRLAGVLVRLGSGAITQNDFDRLLAAECDPKLDVAAWTAPASGLFLDGVRYR